MKRLLGILALVALIGGNAQASVFKQRLSSAQPQNLLMEDDSREAIIDLDGDGVLSVGDELIGFAKIAQTSPPPEGAGNQIYAIFAQKILSRRIIDNGDGTFHIRDTIGAATVNTLAHITGNGAVSADTMIAIIDKSGGFTTDGTVSIPTAPTLALAGGTMLDTDFLAFFNNAALDGLLDEGTVRATMGLRDTDDFFNFVSEDVPNAAPTIWGQNGGTIAGIIPGIPTSIALGSFSGGLTNVDNFMTHVTFNELVVSNRGIHDWVVLNGNLGGTFEGLDLNGNPTRTQGGLPDFLNNADLVTNASVVPEPASMILWSLMGVLGLGYYRRRNRK